MPTNRYKRDALLMWLSLSLVWVVARWMMLNHFEIVGSHGRFFGLGMIGAIIANSTGSGGGVMFIPSFTSLGITPKQILVTDLMFR